MGAPIVFAVFDAFVSCCVSCCAFVRGGMFSDAFVMLCFLVVFYCRWGDGGGGGGHVFGCVCCGCAFCLWGGGKEIMVNGRSAVNMVSASLLVIS